MGKLPGSALEVRLAATLFLLLLGLANLFGAWEVRNFASFTPAGVAASVAPTGHEGHDKPAGPSEEKPIDLATLDEARHHISRELLVQDSHVHIPAYAMTAAFLALIVFALRLSSRARVILVLLGFAAPFLDFVGLWGAHLWSGGSHVWQVGASGLVWGMVTVVGGFLMGLVYFVVLVLTLWQCWFRRQGVPHA